jgi:hypothetical protein
MVLYVCPDFVCGLNMQNNCRISYDVNVFLISNITFSSYFPDLLQWTV